MLKFIIPILIVVCLGSLRLAAESPETVPVWQQKHQELQKQRQLAIEKLTQSIDENPDKIEAYSRRGDLYFFLGDAKSAIADYDRMVELSPTLDASHWRRGIALFYAQRYKDAAAQFDRYHSFDDVDRENGIWRYLSHYKAFGKEKARQELLKYEKDDREPFPSVYKLFAGETTPEKILAEIQAAKITAQQRESRMFYATLYIGLNHVVEGDVEAAEKSLSNMLPNTWGPSAGYGPNFMWEVGRLQHELLSDR